MEKRYFDDEAQTDCPSTDTVSASGQILGVSTRISPLQILVIDDQLEVGRAIEIAFRMAGDSVTVATSPQDGLSRLAQTKFDAVILDMNFSPGKNDGHEGLAFLSRLISEDPAACVVVLTAHGGIRVAVAAMQAGARDFVVKPWRNADLIAKVEGAIVRGKSTPDGFAAAATGRSQAPAKLLGESESIVALRNLVCRVGPTMAGVAIAGPPGAGRTQLALAIHAASAHAAQLPIHVDLREEDASAILECASGTAVLRYADMLDAIDQDRLARELPDTVRAIAIADDLSSFTSRLRRRIATIELVVPGLSERLDDIPILARHFMSEAAFRFGRPQPKLTEAAEAALRKAQWDDEVRGLARTMEKAVLLAEGGVIDVAALSIEELPNSIQSSRPKYDRFDLVRSEKWLIEAALAEHQHNISRAAKALGLSRGALYRRMERYGL